MALLRFLFATYGALAMVNFLVMFVIVISEKPWETETSFERRTGVDPAAFMLSSALWPVVWWVVWESYRRPKQ